MSDNMVERVAKAICQADGDHCVWPDGCGCAHRARAAIEAMREPTRLMLVAGGTDNCQDDYPAPEDAWPAMIDVALAESAHT